MSINHKPLPSLSASFTIHHLINLRAYAKRLGVFNPMERLQNKHDAVNLFRYNISGKLPVRDIANGNLLHLPSKT